MLSDDEIARILKTCALLRCRFGAFDGAIFLGRRDEVVLRLLLDPGVRVSELCGLAMTGIERDGSSPPLPVREPAREWCRSARRPPRPSTATRGCVPCTPYARSPGCCSASAAR
jgi:hypothetical protein